MKGLISSASILVLLLLNACSSGLKVGSDFNAEVDFSTYRSYRWHGGNEFNLASRQYLASDLADQRIRSNVESRFQEKGISLRENGPVDFLINYTVTTEDKIDIDTYNTYSGYAPGWTTGYYRGVGVYRYGGVGFYRAGAVSTQTEVTQFSQGTLILDIVEPINNTLVWRGIAVGKLPQSMSIEARTALIDEAVAEILAAFPPEVEQR